MSICSAIGAAALIVMIICLDLWVGSGAGADAAFSVWPARNGLPISPLLSFVFGTVIGACPFIAWIAFRGMRISDPDTRRPFPALLPASFAHPVISFVVAIGIAATSSLLLIAAVSHGKIDLAAGALTYVLGWLATIATLHAIGAIARGDGASFDSYWGGLGGAQGGWRISPLLVSITLALTLIGGTVAVGTGRGPALPIGLKADASGTGAGDKDDKDTTAKGSKATNASNNTSPPANGAIADTPLANATSNETTEANSADSHVGNAQ